LKFSINLLGISGPILDKMLGIKKVKDNKTLKIVREVKKDIGYINFIYWISMESFSMMCNN